MAGTCGEGGIMNTRFTVNGQRHELSHDPEHSLLSALREELGLTGTKYGCGEGECSACTVLVGSREVRSCVTPLSSVADQQVTTVEGLAEEGYLHPVQQAFLEVGAFQCGYCTPGWITGTAALLQRFPHPSDAQIATELAGHACRCCTYPRILRAVHRAAELLSNPELVEDVAPLTNPVAELWEEGQIPWDLALEDERDFFSFLGDGIVCLVPPEYDIGRAELATKPNRRVGGTWVHGSPDGRVTAFTGKVEIGQGTRTALALLVAEELRVAPTSVAMVMGDTAVSPYDAGTSGSRSMIEIGECLRAAGAAAREAILGLACEHLELAPAELTTSDGWVTGRNTEPRIGWGELLKGVRRLVRVDEAAPITHATDWSTAGKATLALNGADIVTGRKRYPYDLVRPDMVHGQVLRPPSFGATLIDANLDETQADGVTLVRDGELVGVVAPSPSEARAAVAAIKAEWETVDQPGESDLEAHLRAHPIPDGWQN
ncbi:MAG: (2Fe-2S)-binding domain protein, partial [Acidimicrobiaceae bacterium]|nr:(2Fe-2S)-binding domain protein [Acidimicrobiaceae bacterium]